MKKTTMSAREERVRTEESLVLEPYLRKRMLVAIGDHCYQCSCGHKFHSYQAKRHESPSCICLVLENYFSTFQ